ncbi:hypothetical protein L7750_18800 [Xenorhabdus bovienii]|uniref:ApeI dehydratase-like domain-containing protein n=2 Tax=Xenorhabdus bovienii TaxID=40576 RepID=A0A0B6XE57_XENBV|nr:hypothetical protein [Xenorhabdus bovienii]MCG3472348.1 hypothetical protein [Xenorhabdus bovienii]CDM91083.1 conserved protein of unknown function [Xenorhabdus bovienii]
METQFLAICLPLSIEPRREMATGVALLSSWQGHQNHSTISLLIEALNQFAVRYVSSQFSAKMQQRFLPVMIEHFSCKVASCSNKMIVEGGLEPVYNTFRVNCRVYSGESREEIVAQASIIVSEVELPTTPFAEISIENSAISLWEVWPISNHCYGFHLNSGHYLFQEHFPGQPVCPGSLLIDLVFSLCKRNESKTDIIKLHKVKFLKAVRPDHNYTVSLKTNSEGMLGNFFICDENGERHTNGRFSFLQALP